MATKKKANWNEEVRKTTEEENKAWQYKGKDKDVVDHDAKKALKEWQSYLKSSQFTKDVKAQQEYDDYQQKYWQAQSEKRKADNAVKESGATDYESYYQKQLEANKQAGDTLNWESFKRTLGDTFGLRTVMDMMTKGGVVSDNYDSALKAKQDSDAALAYAAKWRHNAAYSDKDFEAKSAQGLQTAADDLTAFNTEMSKGRIGGRYWADYITGTDSDLMVRLTGQDVTTYMPTDAWTEDEKALFGYYYATDKEKAIELGSSINRQAENAADKAAQESLAAEYENASTLGKIGYGAGSILAGASPLGLKDYAYNALGYIGNGSNWVGIKGLTDTQVINGIDTAITESLNAQSGTINENVPIIGGKGAGDAYQLGKSIIDSMITARVSGGITNAALKNGAAETAAEWAGKAVTYSIFFGNAAAQSYDDAMQRGATPGQAVFLGLADGVAEAFFEEFSVEQLIKVGDSATLKELALNILKQNVTEGSEEMLTSIANTVSDALIMQQNSSQQQKIDELVASGMSYEDAYKMAVKDTIEGIVYDAVAGAVSGGISGSIYGGANYLANNSTARYTTGEKVKASEFYGMSNEVAGENTAAAIAKAQEQNKNRKSDTLTNRQLEEIRETWDADKYAAKVSETRAAVEEAKNKVASAAVANAEAVSDVNALVSEETQAEAQSRPTMAGQSIEIDGVKLTTADADTFSTKGGTLFLNASNESDGETAIDLNNADNLKSLPADMQAAVEYARTLFGNQAHLVLNAYDGKMSIETYMTAMDKAANMYEANGMDVEQASTTSLTKALSAQQIETAKRVGLIGNEARITATSKAAAKLSEARKQFNAKTAEGRAVLSDYTSYMRQIRGMMKSEQAEMAQIDRQLKTLDEGSEQYKRLKERKAKLEREYSSNKASLEQMSEQADKLKKADRAAGGVRMDGGTVYESGNPIELKAVDAEKLTDKQKRMVNFVEKLSGVLDIDFVLFDGDAKGAQGAYAGGGTIYVNINAGMAAGRTLIAQAISHELTHYMQNYAPAEYEELKQYIQSKYLAIDAQGFEELVQDRMRDGHLSEAKAIDEIIANTCEDMLFDSKAIKQLAIENMTLAERIREFLKDMRQKLEDAFSDVDDFRREAVFAREFRDQLDELQEKWDRGIYEATHNRRAEIANAEARADKLNDKLQELKSNPQYQTWYETSREADRELTALDKAYESNDTAYIDAQVAKGKLHADVAERLKSVAQLRQDVFAYLDTMPEYSAFKNTPGYMWEDEVAGLFDWDFDPYAADGGNGDAVAQLLNSFMVDELEQLTGKKAERFKKRGYELLERLAEGMNANDLERWGYTSAAENWNEDFAEWYEERHPFEDAIYNEYENGLRFQSWEEEKPIEQVGSSAATSQNQLPALFNLVAKRNGFESGTVNIDVGGGKYEQATDYLKTLGVRNRVFDPFNRSEENNRGILNWLMEGNKADTVTCANVLNVIDSADARANVILETAKALKDGGSAYFIVYEGDKSGNGRVSQVNKKTGDMSWQEHRKTASYVTEIEQYFDDVEVHGKLIVAENPKNNLPKAMWETSFGNATRWQNWDELTPAQQKNYEYNQRQTETGSSLKTLNGSTISRYKNKVGKMMDALYIHKNYVDQIDIPDFKENLAEAERILAETYPEYEYRCIKYAPKKNTIAFQSAPDFDTAREPRVGDYVTVNYQTGTATWSDRGGNYIWHHKWNWVMNDYKGFDVRESWEWSREWLNTLRETSDGNGIQRWNAQLDKYGLPKDGNAVQYQSWNQPENGKAIRKVLAGTMFSGGGTVDFALSAIIDSQFAVEYMPKISAVYRANNDTAYMGQDATKFDPRAIKGKIEYFHASPECKTDSNMISSAAKADRIGRGIDIDMAEAVERVIDDKEPDAFTLENVPGYKDTEAMQIIKDALDRHGYVYDINTYNAADYGAATSRRRIFLRALKNGQLPALPEKVSKRVSWGEVAGDLLDSLPEAKTVNPRMIDSLLRLSGIDVNAIEQPLLVFGESYKDGRFGYAYYDETMPTIIANSGASRVFMPDGRVLEATPRLLARITGLPDDYKLPSDKVTARKIIGNGVPVKLTQAVAGGLLNGMTGQSVQFQTWEQRDKAYMDAVNSGDIETAQRMVDEAAKAAGYNYKVYHGTQVQSKNGAKFPFTVFRGGILGTIYTATNRKLAEDFSVGYKIKGTVYDLYAKLENPLIVNEHRFDEVPWYYNVPVPSAMKEAKAYDLFDKNEGRAATEEIALFAHRNGYSGAVIEGVREGGGTMTDDIIVFDSNLLKSADPVTYDDNGDVISLSQRFDAGKEDIRWQTWDNDHPDLVAVHNKSISGLERMINRGGVPFPSIAIKKAGTKHTGFGDVSIVFPRNTIDPQTSRYNRIYSNDAWTPTEPAIEYETANIREYEKKIKAIVGEDVYRAMRMGHKLDKTEVQRALSSNEGNIVKALGRLDSVKLAYLTEIGKAPAITETEKSLDETYKYKNAQLLYLFEHIPADDIRNADYRSRDIDIYQRIADVLNDKFNQDLRKRADAELGDKRIELFNADKINLVTIQNALRKYENLGKTLGSKIDDTALSKELDKIDLSNDADYLNWVEDFFDGVITDSGIPNGKGIYTDAGNRRSFKGMHIPATMDNIVSQMRKQKETGNAMLGTSFRGAATKAYSSVEAARDESGKLMGEHVLDDEYDAIMEDFNNRFAELEDMAMTEAQHNSDNYYGGVRESLAEIIRDTKSKSAMERMLREYGKNKWLKYSDELADELWKFKADVQNMPAPYFEAKPRRFVSLDEALAVIVPNDTSEALISRLKDIGVDVLTYEKGNEDDRLAKLNSVEGARFQKWDDGTRKSKGTLIDEQEALTRLKSENYQLEEMVKQLTKERDKARKEAAESGRQLKVTKSNEVRKSDSDKLANRYIKELGYTGEAADKQALRDAMKGLGDYIVNVTGETIDYDVLKARARAIAGELVRNASVLADDSMTVETGARERMDALHKELTGRTYRLPQQDEGEIEQAFGSVKNFRDKYFGKFFVSSAKGEAIDTLYAQLRNNELGDNYSDFLPEANSLGEMLLNIAAAVDKTERVYANPFRGNIEESTEAYANEIIFDVISDEVRQALPTFADVKEGQIRAERAKGAEKERRAYELGVVRLNALRDEKNARIAQIRQQGMADKKAAVAKEKADKWKAVAKERDYWRNRIAEATAQRNESTAVKKYLKSIKKDVADLIAWSVKPSDKDIRKHVPAEIQSAVRDFVLSIDMSSKRLLGGGEATKSDRAVAKSMEKMRRILDSKVNTGEIYSGRYDLPSNFIEEFGRLTAAVNELTAKGKGGYILNAMSAAELKELRDTLKVIKQLIYNMNVLHNNQMFAHDYEAGENSTKFIAELGDARRRGVIGDKAYNFMEFGNMRPVYVFDRFGEGGQSIFQEFVEAQDELAKLTNEIISFRDKNYSAEEAKAWAEEMHEFEVNGEKIQMTTAQLMSLYCLNRREQGRTHIFGEGFRVATTVRKVAGKFGIKQKYVYRDAGHMITQEDIGKMLDELTPEQKALAEKMQEFMSTTCSGWGNYVTRIRFNVDGFTEPYYFPINSDGRILPANADEMPGNASLYALLNAGFTKELKENANNRIILYNIFDVFANHTASMAQYRAFALPVLDALKWFNYANDETSLRDEMAKAFGAPEEKTGSGARGYAESFVINYLKAVNGTSVQGDPYDGTLMSLLHAYNRAAIAFNGRVVIQQPMAITRAAMFLKSADLMEGMRKSLASRWKLADEMETYSGMAQWKALGFYDTNVSRGLTDMISYKEDFGEKVTELGTSWAEKADRLTWAAIWYAAKKSVNPADFGTEEEYFAEVTRVFENVIVRSQVVDSIVTKSEFMRAKGFVARSFGSFMGEPTTTISMLTDAGFKYELDVQSGMTGRDAFKKNSKYIKATIANYVVSQALLAVVQSIYDAWRDDDEYKTWLEKYLEALEDNTISELNPLGKIPYVKDIIEITKEILRAFGADTYGNVNSGVFGTISEYVIKIAQIIGEMQSEDGSNYTGWALLYKCLQLGSAVTGLPMATGFREAKDLWNNTVGRWTARPIKLYDGGVKNETKWAYKDGYLTEEEAADKLIESGEVESREEALKLIYGWGTDGGDYDAIKQTVESGTPEQFEAVKAEMEAHGFSEDTINATIRRYIRELYVDSSKAYGKTDAVNALQAYAGFDAKTANDTVAYWWVSKEYKAEIDTDGNGSVKMDELGEFLTKLIRSGEIDSTEAQSIWNGCNPNWKTSYSDWKKKQ